MGQDEELRSLERAVREGGEASAYFASLRRLGASRLDAARRISEVSNAKVALRAALAGEGNVQFASLSKPVKRTAARTHASPVGALAFGIPARVEGREVKPRSVLSVYGERHRAAMGVLGAIVALPAFERTRDFISPRLAIEECITAFDGKADAAELERLGDDLFRNFTSPAPRSPNPRYVDRRGAAICAIHSIIYATLICQGLVGPAAEQRGSGNGFNYALSAVWNLEVDRAGVVSGVGPGVDPTVTLLWVSPEDAPDCFSLVHVAALDLLDVPEDQLAEHLRTLLRSVVANGNYIIGPFRGS